MPNNNFKKHFTASALIMHDNKVLLVNHVKLGVWLYPGGHIEDNETPDETVVREVKEETGLGVTIISDMDNSLSDEKMDVSSLHLPYAFLCELVGDHYHNDLVYLCRITSGDTERIISKADECSDIRFFKEEELDKIKLFPNFKTLLKKVFSATQSI